MEGGTWAQQEGAGVVSGVQGCCIAGGQETDPAGGVTRAGDSASRPLWV